MKQRALDANIICAGFVAVITQSVLIRELTSLFSGNELTIGFIFSSWLFWTAAGSFVTGRIADRLKIGIKSFIFTQIGVSVLLPSTIIVVRCIRYILDIPIGEMIGYTTMVFSVFSVLAPISVVVGAQFVIACKICLNPGRVYVADAVGYTIGGAVFGYIFIKLLPLFCSASVASTINLIMALLLSHLFGRSLLRLFLSFLLLLSLFCTLKSAKIDRLTTFLGWKGFELVETATSEYSRLAVIKRDSLYSFYQDGVLSFNSPDIASAEELVHISMLQTTPKRVLIVSGGVSGILYEILKYPIEEVYYIELDPAVIEIAKPYISPSDLSALSDPRTRLFHTDARLFVKGYRGPPFDCIIVNIGDPSTAQKNRFYTAEFFEEIKEILSQDGILTLCVTSAENYIGESLLYFNGCIYHTLKEVFPNILLAPGDRLFLIASTKGGYLTQDPRVLSERLKDYGIKTSWIDRYYFMNKLSTERIGYVRKLLEGFEVKINTDFHPVCYWLDIVLWGGVFSERVEKILSLFSKIRFEWMLILFLSLLCIIFFLLKKAPVPIGVSVVGGCGITTEVVLVIGFCTIYGYIYHLIGVIIASFMLGIVLSARWMNKRVESIKRRVLFLAILQMAFASYLLLIPIILYVMRMVDAGVAQIIFPLLTAFAGLVVGATFCLACKAYAEGGVGKVSGTIYSADLIGACIGSFSASAFFIPVFGIIKTCLFFSALSFVCFLLLIVKRI